MHHYLQAVFRESNRERYYETPVAAKAKTVHAKEPRKPSRKLLRIRTKSFTMLFCLVPKQQLVASPASSINFVAARSFKGAVLISRCPTFQVPHIESAWSRTLTGLPSAYLSFPPGKCEIAVLELCFKKRVEWRHWKASKSRGGFCDHHSSRISTAQRTDSISLPS